MIRRNGLYTLILVLITLSASTGCRATPALPIAQTTSDELLLLRDVSIIDGTGTPPQPHQDLLIRNGRIEWIATSGSRQPPPGTALLDLPGRTVIPGLIDMHAHLVVHPRGTDGSFQADWDRRSSLEMLRTLLDFGVTTVRDPGASTEEAVTLRNAVNLGAVAGPRIFTAGRILISIPFDPDDFVYVADREDVLREIEWQHAAGVDFVKVYSRMPVDPVRYAIEQAHARGIRVTGHLGDTTWLEGAELGIDGIEHPASWGVRDLPEDARGAASRSLFGRVYWLRNFDLDSEHTKRTVRALRENQVTVDPTLMAVHTKFWGNSPRYTENPDNLHAPDPIALQWPETSFTRSWSDADFAEAQEQWPKLLEWIRFLHDSGVKLTVGTDSPTPWIVPGVAVHDEMALLADAGIPPLEIIRMATGNGASALGIDHEVGRVQAGYEADLVVLARDPSTDIRNTRSIELVIQRGRPIDLKGPR